MTNKQARLIGSALLAIPGSSMSSQLYFAGLSRTLVGIFGLVIVVLSLILFLIDWFGRRA